MRTLALHVLVLAIAIGVPRMVRWIEWREDLSHRWKR